MNHIYSYPFLTHRTGLKIKRLRHFHSNHFPMVKSCVPEMNLSSPVQISANPQPFFTCSTTHSHTNETVLTVKKFFLRNLEGSLLFTFVKMDTLKTVTTETLKLEQKLEHRLTILWHELQEWQKDNHFIYSGYRPASNSYRKSWMRYTPVLSS